MYAKSPRILQSANSKCTSMISGVFGVLMDFIIIKNHSGVNFILRISNKGGPGVEVEHLRVIAQLFLSSEVFLIFP